MFQMRNFLDRFLITDSFILQVLIVGVIVIIYYTLLGRIEKYIELRRSSTLSLERITYAFKLGLIITVTVELFFVGLIELYLLLIVV